MKLEVKGREAYCHTGDRGLDPDRESLLFIHGAAMDHSVWIPALMHFCERDFNAIAVDLPGHGHSAGPLLPDIEAMSDWLVAIMDSLGIAQAVLVGHSMGSLVALDAAARHPQRVHKFALLGSTAPMPVADAILTAARNNDPAAFHLLTQWGYSKRYLYGANTSAGVFMRINTLEVFERCAAGVLYNDMNACNNYSAGLQRASEITCPGLLILGEDDRLTPLEGCAPLRAALRNTEVLALPACGHTIMAEAPDAMVKALDSLLQQPARSPGQRPATA